MRAAFVYIRDVVIVLLVLAAFGGMISLYYLACVMLYVGFVIWSIALERPRCAILKLFKRINRPLPRRPGGAAGISVPPVPSRTKPRTARPRPNTEPRR
jgi:hypothetical protein